MLSTNILIDKRPGTESKAAVCQLTLTSYRNLLGVFAIPSAVA